MSRLVNAITSLLEDLGPMTRVEIETAMPEAKVSISAVMSRMHKNTPANGKRIYIKSYVYDSIGLKRYPRAVYALGNKPDAKKPIADKNENRKRYVQKKVKQHTTNSVFHLGRTQRWIRKEMRLAA